ncbi:MAG: hypothetical protein ACYTGV_03985 [Planctomycetota bacterium]|jgi:hypothetical protein
MSTIRFRAGEVDLELHGSESFVTRQLLLFAPYLGRVDTEALADAPAEIVAAATPAPTQAEPVDPAPAPPDNGDPQPGMAEEVAGDSGSDDPATAEDELVSFYRSFRPHGRDRQSDAALLFSYFLQRKEGMDALALGDLIRCCIRAGVDTRNFNRALGTLTRRGFLEPVRPGHAYRLSDQGAAAVESRM